MITIKAADNLAKLRGATCQIEGNRIVFFYGPLELGSTIITNGMVAETSVKWILSEEDK